MLEMINVSYAYKSKKEIVHVLDKVTYRFEIGEMYGIFGPSGSGKTTCLSLLAGLEKPDEGENFAGWRKYTKHWWKKTAPK